MAHRYVIIKGPHKCQCDRNRINYSSNGANWSCQVQAIQDKVSIFTLINENKIIYFSQLKHMYYLTFLLQYNNYLQFLIKIKRKVTFMKMAIKTIRALTNSHSRLIGALQLFIQLYLTGAMKRDYIFVLFVVFSVEMQYQNAISIITIGIITSILNDWCLTPTQQFPSYILVRTN